MSDQSNKSASPDQGRSRVAVAVIVSLFLFSIVFLALWAFTTIGFLYALATATPVTIMAACSIAMLDAVGDFFAGIVDAIVALIAAIVEAIGSVLAAVLAALAAVFSIFGG